MKLQFRHQKFQADAAKAVADVFAGQPFLAYSAGWANAGIVPALSDNMILENLNKVQRKNQIAPSRRLEGRYNLTIEMETGVGKTYTYIKTMYELNKRYGWSRFIVVVPSIAVREGVYKSFQVTQEHFAGEYGRKIHFFIYHSSRLTEIDRFASDPSMNVMIINAQAFNARGKDARRIYMELDDFRSRRPIDILAGTNPIMIIDEPQSVEGKQTRENLKQFNPLMTLRYSATHKADSIYNMVYRLDAADAFQKRLVKRIAVKGITQTGTAAADSYVYLESIHLSKADPAATIQFDYKTAAGLRRKSQKAGIGFDLYVHSGGLSEYRDGFVIKSIDGRDGSVEFINGLKLYAGDVSGKAGEEQLRRIQIRETILSHMERERQLFHKGIKVLSLFFIDEVAHYREYDRDGRPKNGIFAQMFEEEYQDIAERIQHEAGAGDYGRYLAAIPVSSTHAGYFSIDKKGHIVNQVAGDDKKSRTSNDTDAYDLIMKNKELLLERDPKKSPVRFLFSHSALREGWDNPNVFQICTLKQSGSEVRKRQEVGRGLRLCVNQDGERMDEKALGSEVHDINVLTVIASESYDSFARSLQAELAESVEDRPEKAGAVYDSAVMIPEDARRNNVEPRIDREKLNSEAFMSLWSAMNAKSVYTVDFDTEELVKRAVDSLNRNLYVPEIFFQVESGRMGGTGSEEEPLSGVSVVRTYSADRDSAAGSRGTGYDPAGLSVSRGVKYDLAGKLVDETGLTRKTVIRILTGIEKPVFGQFRDNPEEFIMKAASLINDQKAAAVMEHITYRLTGERYDTEIFTEPAVKGRLGVNAMRTEKHLYDHLIYHSVKERAFAEKLDAADEVAVYVKLPDSFYIPTPFGRYTPDWAVAFRGETVKHIYFAAETEGSDAVRRSFPEKAKLHCAREHFKAVGNGAVVCDVVDSYEELRRKAME
ncbi:MAG: DEAD/DEAH box helicase family protein [Blautia sp.]|nr:DEAD/DEAH box helicase family protein [Blautia sp.]MCM1202491.1 DEAD/DEAH box helicase family protein [Bacteroides fragilis]